MAAFSHKQTGNPISHQAISPRKYNMFGSQLRLSLCHALVNEAQSWLRLGDISNYRQQTTTKS